MFNKEEFAKNKFILQQECLDYSLPSKKNQEKPMHIAFNVDDGFFMQTGVAITSILEKQKVFGFIFFVMELVPKTKKKCVKPWKNITQNVLYTLWIWLLFKLFILRPDIFLE